MEKKLQRYDDEKMIAGVCAGLADYLDIDVTWIRIAFVVAVLAGFSGLLAYIILWIAVPTRPFNPDFNKFNTDYRVYEDKGFSNNPTNSYNSSPQSNPYVASQKNEKGKVIIGLLLIAFGGIFLLDEFNIIPYWFNFGKLWPLVFIIPGIIMITKAGKKKELWKEDYQTKSNTTPTTVVTEEKQPDTEHPIT